jgi:D-alanine-D-alanine ligase
MTENTGAQGRAVPGGKRTLGPISNLESHLPPEWWRTLFDALYLKTDGDVVESSTNTEAEVSALIEATALKSGDRILDLCCGQGRHAIELAKRGFTDVTGIDRSRYLVRLARRRARSLGLSVNFHEGDGRKFRLPRVPYDCVAIMGNSFGYFDASDDDRAVLERVRKALVPGGTLVLDLTDGDWMRSNFEPRSWEWIDENQFVCRERSLASDGDRLISREVVVHAEQGVIADQFYAERLYSVDAITRLLEQAGFIAVTVHRSLRAESERGQDLGMMGARLLISSRSSETGLSWVARHPVERITVLLGDPRLPDEVKLEGKFNELDVDTVARLKAALAEIPGYAFDYRDDHAGLFDGLRDDKPEFVFNLCDEGYRNNALHELHVPAYLEALDIPYSGAGPASLGLCYNKSLVRAIAASVDVPVPLESYASPDDVGASIPSIFPALIKPALGDSSLGITKDAVVHDAGEATGYLNYLRRVVPGRPVLVQEYLSGAEYTVALIGNPGQGLTPLPVLEVDFGKLPDGLPKILSYESKWDPVSPYWTQIGYRAAELDEETRRVLVDMSVKLFERLECRDYARFDFRADSEGTIKLLEVNPNPGWCWDGKLNLMAEMAGWTYADLLRQIIDAALGRCFSGVPAVRKENPGVPTLPLSVHA